MKTQYGQLFDFKFAVDAYRDELALLPNIITNSPAKVSEILHGARCHLFWSKLSESNP